MSIHRLYRLYELASESEKAQGRAWYDTARADIAELAIKHATIPGIVAGIVAALSPNTRWAQNLEDADSVLAVGLSPYTVADYQDCIVTTYNLNKVKAFAIAEQYFEPDKRSNRNPLNILRGPKVVAFYLNLIGNSNALTLDSHAYNAFCGFRATGSDLPGMRAQLTRDARKAYERAAFVKGETVASFQAIIWLTWKARVDAGKVAGYEK